MATDLIRYDLLIQDALRGVVRRVLADVARDGLTGDHHFYITFRTHARGVRLSTRMREQYPDEMTIILQHQFWDLSVTDQAFEVGLSFKNVPEKLLIPFEAVTRFSDPSVEFDLKFEPEEEIAETGANDTGSPGQLGTPKLVTGTEPAAGSAEDAAPRQGSHPAPDIGSDSSAEANVVSIDAFRKKT
jgi:hypothetical protein